MKKQRPPRPKHKKGRRAAVAKPKTEIAPSPTKGQIASSTVGTGPLGSSRAVERPRPPVEAKGVALSDRGVVSNARGWCIFVGFIISWLLLADVVVLVATHWT